MRPHALGVIGSLDRTDERGDEHHDRHARRGDMGRLQSWFAWRMFPAVRCCIATGIAFAFAIAGASSAAAETRISVVSAGSCPLREAVIAALAQVMPGVAIAADAGVVTDAEPVVVVSDDGASYRTVVRGIVRTLVDPPANCEERARKVAIVAALALEPPLNATAVPQAIETVATRPPSMRSHIGVRVESGILAERGTFMDTRLSPLGGTVRMTIERDGLGLVIGGALVQWSSVDSSVFAQRIPIDLSVQLRHRIRWFAGALELGPSLVFQRGRDGSDRAVHLEADLRASGRVELWFQRGLGVFAAVTGTYIPNPAPLVRSRVEYPMPSWWLGASTGLVIQIR